LFGFLEEGELIRISIKEVTMTSSWLVGALVGFNRSGKVEESRASGKINGRVSGGLIGENHGEIYKSSANVEVSNIELMSSMSGGLVGINCEDGVISNSYSIGNVNGYNDVGGLVGYNCAEINNSFSTGKVIFNGEEEDAEYVGGFVGFSDGLVGAEIISSYWDEESSNRSRGVGFGPSEDLTNLKTSEMQGTAAEENMLEFDWDEIWMTVQGDYPNLRWQQD